jgi:hypothetical protein
MLNALRFLVIFALMCGSALGLIQGLRSGKMHLRGRDVKRHLSPCSTGSAQRQDAWPCWDCSGSSYGLRLTREIQTVAFDCDPIGIGRFWRAS